MRPESQVGADATATPRVVFHIRSRHSLAPPSTTEPISLAKTDGRGIAVGRQQCPHDPLVSPSHGTLECTLQHQIWVYVDHSDRGTLLNHKQLIHRDAAIVQDGDVLTLGTTEITLVLNHKHRPLSPMHSRPDNQEQHNVLSPRLTSALAKQLLPSINTDPRPPPPLLRNYNSNNNSGAAPEYINSPIPGTNWRKKRHSISHVSTRMPISHGLAASSQIFSRSKQPLVPSAPSTPPQKDALARPVAHHHHVAVPTTSTHSPQSAVNHQHVSYKDSQPEPARPTEEDDDDHDGPDGSQPRPPPLEYSSSPMTSSSFLHRPQQPAAPVPTPTPTPPPPVSVFTPAHPHPFDSPPPKTAGHRPENLRIQVAKRNATLASNQQRAATAGAATRPAALARGITIANPSAPQSILKHSPQQARRVYGDGLTPPASPVAHQDILQRNASLHQILKARMKQEQKLQEEQEEWIRRQQPAVPSMSPIRHESMELTSEREDDDDAGLHDDAAIAIPPKAPALLRTVSLGHTIQVAHQPSPRLTAAVLASRAARTNSFDGRAPIQHQCNHHHHHHPPPPPSPGRPVISSRDALDLAISARLCASDDSSVTSSVSTEPANHRRVTRSLSFSSSRVASSGELSDFMGYDDDDDDDASDGLRSFTSFFGDDGGPTTRDSTARARVATDAATDAVLSPSRRPRHHRHTQPLRSRAPSLDDEIAGMGLNSPSAAAATRFSDPFTHRSFGSSPPGALRTKPLFHRMHHQLRLDDPHER